MKKSRRASVRIISYLCAVVIALTIWAGVSTYKLVEARNEVRRSNERALTQLGTYLDDISLNLQKCTYLRSENMLSDVSTKLWRSSASAKESLSEITDGNTEISGVYKFLSQVGEYTLSLNESISKGKSLSKEESNNLTTLLKYSKKLSEDVNNLISQEEEGALSFDEIKSTLQKDGEEKTVLGDKLNDANQSLGDYPVLIYDGPFSDHIQNKKSSLLSKAENVSEEEAKEKAAAFLKLKAMDLKLLSKVKGNLSSYTFYNGDYTISVTQNGGIVSSMLTDSYAEEIKLTTEQAIKKATKFLKEKGYTEIKESYFSTTDGICTVNFAFYEKGITYYTDLIKVSVALDDGAITAFDATGYLMNHTQRSIPKKIKYSIEQGEKLLKKDLRLLSSKKVFIPTEWETEEYAYEYHCKAPDGEEVLIYIDPVTGQEKNILILLYSDGGRLTK